MIRSLFGVLAALLLFAAQPSAAQPAAPQSIALPALADRSIPLSIWRAEEERGVVVFSHGFGGSPAAYQRIISAWVAHGYTVLAPTHLDSREHPGHAAASGQAAFMTRIEDMAVVRGYARAAHPEAPVVAAGHSFGSLLSLMQAGAVTVAGPQGDPQVRGVIAFSSPGAIQGVVTPQTYASLAAPVLMITGDQDVVEGFAPDPAVHRQPFDQAPAGGHTLITFAGGGHDLVARADEADFALIVEATLDFLDAHAQGDEAALARLRDLSAPDGVLIERR